VPPTNQAPPPCPTIRSTMPRTAAGTERPGSGLATRIAADDTRSMALTRWAGLTNPATWYLALGFLMLGTSIWVPFATASRTTRVEGRADAIAMTLLEATVQWPVALTDADLDVVMARFHALAERDRIHVADLEVLEPAWPDTLLSLRNKHYLFHLAVSPLTPDADSSRVAAPSYEVMAWPRRGSGPAHSVFFHPDNALPAYTRNLAKGYEGDGSARPIPGCAQRRQAIWEWTKSYRGQDDERWIVHRGWVPPR